MAGKPLSNPNAVHPDCMLCKDTGIQHLPDYPPCYRFCACAAGASRQYAEPGLCGEANARELALQVNARDAGTVSGGGE